MCSHHHHEDHHEQMHDHMHDHMHEHHHEHMHECESEKACCSCQCACSSVPFDVDNIEMSSTKSTYFISQMDCAMEEALIRKKLESVSGIHTLEFNLMQRILKVTHEPQLRETITRHLDSLKMGARLLQKEEKIKEVKAEIPWGKLVIGGIFALLAEVFEFTPFAVSDGIATYIPLLFSVIAILCVGLNTYKKGWIAISNLNLNINALMSVAVTGALIIGEYPEAAMVMVLFQLSEAIESRALYRARDAIKGLLALASTQAHVLQADGTYQIVDRDEVSIGAIVRVIPGEKIPLDGIVCSGASTVNQAPITGESLPVEKKKGDFVFAGTINEVGTFEFEVSAKSEETTLARIIHAVEEAQSTKAPIQRFVDVFAKYYTPIVFLVAIAVSLILPFLGWGWMRAAYMALVILVIGCPCALVISTPVTIVSAMAAATKSGLLIKGGSFLEEGRLIKWLAFDKTGTITYGRPQLTDIVNVTDLTKEECLDLAQSLSSYSDHPVSKAIAAKKSTQKEVNNFKAILGKGIQGDIEGKTYYLGNEAFAKEKSTLSFEIKEVLIKLQTEGKTVVLLVRDHDVIALFAVLDTMRPSSVLAIKSLQSLGVKTLMLTGDNEKVASRIAKEAGIDAFEANLLPENKLKAIEDLQQKREKVGMVGDGINDAPALAKADFGFAMAKGGTDTAIETADIALMDDDLQKIVRFISLSKSTYSILIQNITLALGVKALFFFLTIIGLSSMWMAVFADVGTALLVVANGLRMLQK